MCYVSSLVSVVYARHPLDGKFLFIPAIFIGKLHVLSNFIRCIVLFICLNFFHKECGQLYYGCKSGTLQHVHKSTCRKFCIGYQMTVYGPDPVTD